MLRKALGRGLGALIESGENQQPSAQPRAVTSLRVEQLSPSPFQPRRNFDAEHLDELTRAIQRQGIIEPLIVRRASEGADGFELVAGERRLRAAKAAGLTEVPVIVRELDDREALEISLVENLARQDLNAIEEARALSKLHTEFELSHEDIATRIGKSRPYVSNAIRLLDLAAEVIVMVEKGELSAGQVRPLLALSSHPDQVAAAKRIASRGMSARGAEALMAERRTGTPREIAKHGDPNLLAMVNELQRSLKRKVRIIKARGKTPGWIEIEYYDDKDLSALARTLNHQGTARPAITPAA